MDKLEDIAFNMIYEGKNDIEFNVQKMIRIIVKKYHPEIHQEWRKLIKNDLLIYSIELGKKNQIITHVTFGNLFKDNNNNIYGRESLDNFENMTKRKIKKYKELEINLENLIGKLSFDKTNDYGKITYEISKTNK